MINIKEYNQYNNLTKAGHFYLEEAFDYINKALRKELRDLIYKKQQFSFSEDDNKGLEKFDTTKDIVGFLRRGNENFEWLTAETLNNLLETHKKTDEEISKIENYKFQKDQKVKNIEILGHLNNFAFFIEVLTNRHLLFLKDTKQISPFAYNQISTSKVLNRIIYICKDQLNKEKLNLNEITNLFKLRNKTVHYTPLNSISLQVKLSELIRIWNQSHTLIEIYEKEENFNEKKFSSRLKFQIEILQDAWL